MCNIVGCNSTSILATTKFPCKQATCNGVESFWSTVANKEGNFQSPIQPTVSFPRKQPNVVYSFLLCPFSAIILDAILRVSRAFCNFLSSKAKCNGFIPHWDTLANKNGSFSASHSKNYKVPDKTAKCTILISSLSVFRNSVGSNSASFSAICNYLSSQAKCKVQWFYSSLRRTSPGKRVFFSQPINQL